MPRPPVIAADPQLAPADRVFRAVDPAAVPEIAPVLVRLAANDPDVLLAVAVVDRSLIWAAMERSPSTSWRTAWRRSRS